MGAYTEFVLALYPVSEWRSTLREECYAVWTAGWCKRASVLQRHLVVAYPEPSFGLQRDASIFALDLLAHPCGSPCTGHHNKCVARYSLKGEVGMGFGSVVKGIVTGYVLEQDVRLGVQGSREGPKSALAT